MIGRREFITLLGGAVAAWPRAARAQQAARLPIIGFLGSLTPSSQSQWTAVFVQRLRELGWIEGQNVAIEYRWAEGQIERASEIASEFVRLRVNVILASGAMVIAAKRATSVIPIVFAASGDPVANGYIASLSHPGGNLTGLSLQQTDLAAKRLELLREVVPTLRRLAVIGNIAVATVLLEMGEVEAAARNLDVQVDRLEIQRVEDITAAVKGVKGRADGLYVCADPFLTSNRLRIHTLSMGARLPTVHGFREYADAGGLISYGPNFPDLFRRAADYVDKVLRGANPGDIPVEQPTKFDLVINLVTAKALDLEVPPTLLARADEVIE
jgi:putative tryptophan/tyrosine transport system substrate-binding protein